MPGALPACQPWPLYVLISIATKSYGRLIYMLLLYNLSIIHGFARLSLLGLMVEISPDITVRLSLGGISLTACTGFGHALKYYS